MGKFERVQVNRPTAATVADALFSGTQQRVLGFLFGQPGRSFYATELISLVGAGSGGVQRELAWLERSGLVTLSRVGTQKHYQANPDSILFDELCSIARKVLPAGAGPARFGHGSPAGQAQVLHSPQAKYEAAGTGRLRIPKPRIAALCRKYRIRKLSLFGSAARNEMTASSDVDLLVEFDPKSKVTLFDLPKIREAFSALFGNRKIDLATPEILENPFRRRAIESDLKTLYAA
jgi:predicted nucleotidyltransferase